MSGQSSPFTVTPDGAKFLTRQAGDIPFLLADAPRPENCRAHSHPNARVGFLISGVIREVDDQKRSVERGPHSMHMSPADMMHAHWIESTRLTTLCFDLTPTVLETLENRSAIEEPIVIKSGTPISLMMKMHREILAQDSASDVILQGLVYEILGEVVRRKTSRPATEPPPWLRHARELLRDRSTENVSVVEVAKAVGVHPSYLTRMFRAYLNESPGEYVRRIRMERATKQVLLTDQPLKQIAEIAGFADQAHFSREFRRFHGHSPQRLRQDMRR